MSDSRLKWMEMAEIMRDLNGQLREIRKELDDAQRRIRSLEEQTSLDQEERKCIDERKREEDIKRAKKISANKYRGPGSRGSKGRFNKGEAV